MRPRSFLSVIAFLFAGVSACTAQAPANDAFANRQIITGAFPQTVGGTTVSATAEGQEPGHADFFGGNVASNSVWFRWTSTFDGYLSVEVTGAAFDTAVAIYTGSALNSLVEIDSADRYILANERAIAEVQGGVIYSVAVDGFSTSAGTAGESGPFELVLSQFSTPSNDDFASAEVLTSVFGAEAVEGHTVAATAEAGEPDHANLIVSGGNLASNSVWYRWTAPVDGFVGANVESTFDASIGVYTGTALANLVEIGASDFYESQAPERALFDAVAGTEYFIAVDGFTDSGANGAAGTFFLEVYEVPGNDDFFNSTDLGSTLPVSVEGTTVNASSEFVFDEPDHANSGGAGENLSSNSVWYTWEAPLSETVTIAVVAPEFDSVLAVYTGTELENLVGAASADIVIGDGGESVAFAVTAGTSYVIAVDEWSGDGEIRESGSFTLTITGESVGGDTPYEDWIANFPSIAGADAEAGANPSGDGVSNLIKLVLGLDPTLRLATDPSRANYPQLRTFNGNPALQYTINPDNLGIGGNAIEHGGQTSGDLANWTELTGAINIGGDVWVIEIVPGAANARFGRLAVSE